MEFVSMEMSKKERKSMYGQGAALPTKSEEGPLYPYGLELSLEKSSIDKLGIDFKKMSVGDEIDISCKGKITRLSTNERSGGEADKSMSIQITDMAIDHSDELDWETKSDKATEIMKKRGI